MKQKLYPTTVYLDEHVKKEIDLISLATGEAKSLIIRDALERGLTARQKEAHRDANGSPAVQALLKLSGLVQDEKLPHDLADNHDKYIYDEE
jgi:metal-responsive CopG/Arc/MetJ family transcriptional regulator